MKHLHRSAALQFGWLLGLVPVPLAAGSQQLDETWTVTVDGQSVQAEANGTYRIPNLLVFDNLGLGGPDGVSDSYVRVVATRQTPGGTEYAISQPFLVFLDGTVRLGPEDLLFVDQPPLLPVSLDVDLSPDVLTTVGMTSQALVLAELPDGSLADVTSPTTWTSYTSSNPDVASVDTEGWVTAHSSGLALITARNDGAVAAASVQVALGAEQTTVAGLVLEPDGSPVAGASVEVVGQLASGTGDAAGSFQLANVLSDVGPLSLSVTGEVGGQSSSTQLVGIEPNPGEFTDAGIAVLEPSNGRRFLYVESLSKTDLPVPQASQIVGFEIGDNGALASIPGATVDKDLASNPTPMGSSIAATADGRFLYRMSAGGDIFGYEIGADGGLTEVAGSPFVPTDPLDRYRPPFTVTSANRLLAYQDRPTEPIVRQVRALEISATGALLDTGALAPVQGVVPPRQFLANPSGDRLHVLTPASPPTFPAHIDTFEVPLSGPLVELASLDFPGLTVSSMALSPGGDLMLVSSAQLPAGTARTSSHPVLADGTPGAALSEAVVPPLSAVAAAITGLLTISPTGGHCDQGTAVNACSPAIGGILRVDFDPLGQLLPPPPGTFSAQDVPRLLAIPNSGTHLYLVDDSNACGLGAQIESFSIAANGALSPFGTAIPLPVGAATSVRPRGLVIVE